MHIGMANVGSGLAGGTETNRTLSASERASIAVRSTKPDATWLWTLPP